MRKFGLLAIAGITLAACASTPGTTPEATTPPSPATPPAASADEVPAPPSGALPDAAIWRDEGDGHLRHIPSGAICPSNWGSFNRTDNVEFKSDGSDVGCGYFSEELYTTLTFYIYRNSEPMDQEFAAVMDLVKNRVPVHEDTDFPGLGPSSSGGFSYLSDAIEFKNSVGAKIRSAALLTEHFGWRLKMRVTYPAEFAAQIETIAGTMLLGQYENIMPGGVAPVAPDAPPALNQKT